MKRLIKKSNMVPISELDEADVRHDRCPVCKSSPLERKDGFKICNKCTTVFKVFDGTGYVVKH